MPITNELIELIIITAVCYFIVWWPCGAIIGWKTKGWRAELEEDQKGLLNAGRWIGYLERTLVFTFIILQQYSAVGLLIAAKSILRVSDKNSRKQTEYILIGTLMSFSLAFAMGLAFLFLRRILLI